MVARGVAIVPVTSTVVGEEEGEVTTLSPEGGEWMTMTQTLLEAMDLIALSMVDDKKNKKQRPFHLLYVHACACAQFFLYRYMYICTSACVAIGILCILNLG